MRVDTESACTSEFTTTPLVALVAMARQYKHWYVILKMGSQVQHVTGKSQGNFC